MTFTARAHRTATGLCCYIGTGRHYRIYVLFATETGVLNIASTPNDGHHQA